VSSGYLIPAETRRVDLRVSNSRFIASASRASTVEAAKELLNSIRREMPDASHHVYAYRIGYGNSVTDGMSDDGEPSGTAGPPVLAIVRGSEIGDIIVVVTRYFGGTKLGTGGLVRAYGDAARAVLAKLKTERKIEHKTLGITTPYPFFQPIRRLLGQHQGTVLDEQFAADVTMFASFPLDEVEPFIQAVIDLSAGSVYPTILDS
jgi:uncharacterized YigZ family protein